MKNQYFMYGVLISYQAYLELKTIISIEDVLKGDDDVQGIFTGRNSDFLIIGKVLKNIDEQDTKPLIVPELQENEMIFIKSTINKKYGIHGHFNYYFVTKTK